ncbi:MAG: M1 family aminopeptidase [Bacteroidota bacterium]
MKYFLILLSAIAFSANAQEHFCAAGKQQFAQTLLGKTANTSQVQLMEKYDVKFHHLNLNVERDTSFISGNVRTLAKVTAAQLDTFGFELHDQHTIDSVVYQNQKLTITHNNHFAYVKLPAPVMQDGLVDITIYYHGDAHVTAGAAIGSGFSSAASSRWGNRATWSLSQPYSAYEWWPCKQSLQDKIDSTYTFITTNNQNKAGSQGLLQRVVNLPNNKSRYEWKSFYPVDYYLISVAVAKYIEYKTYAVKEAGMPGPDSILIQDYIYDNPNALVEFKPVLDQTASMINAFARMFGPYPFANEKYGHSLAPFSGGMEHQTMTSIGVIDFSIVAHELGHQWFGDHVTCKTWKDIWLNEGFATYCEYLAAEALKPETKELEMQGNHAQVMQANDGSIWFEDTSDVSRIFSSRLTYAKGGAFIHILRFEINNDSLFFNILQTYQQQFGFATANTIDLKTLVEQKTGRSFSAIFDQWFYGQGYPTFNTTWNKIGDTLYVKTDQTTSSSITPLFITPIEYAITVNGTDSIVRVNHTRSTEYYKFPLSGTVTKVVSDPDNWLINKSTSIEDKTLTALNGIFTHRVLLNVYPNPADHTLTIDDAGFGNTVKIYDLAGRLVSSEAFNTPSINTGTLKKGFYFIEVSGNNQVGFARFVKN